MKLLLELELVVLELHHRALHSLQIFEYHLELLGLGMHLGICAVTITMS